MVKKKKKAANNRFACFADTDEESEYETDHEEDAPAVQYQRTSTTVDSLILFFAFWSLEYEHEFPCVSGFV